MGNKSWSVNTVIGLPRVEEESLKELAKLKLDKETAQAHADYYLKTVEIKRKEIVIVRAEMRRRKAQVREDEKKEERRKKNVKIAQAKIRKTIKKKKGK